MPFICFLGEVQGTEVRGDVTKQIICPFITLGLLLLLVPGSGCTHTSTSPGKIAFVSDREGEPFIYVMNPDGSNPTKIGGWFGVPNTFCWSPDGERIAFINEDGWLCLVDAGGGSLSKIAEIPSYSISWSPDGGEIAAGCFDYDIYTVDIGTGELQNLTNTTDIVESLPAWSPDSGKIAFVVYNPPYCEIALMDADGSNQTTITSERGICEELAWSPGGGRVCYAWYSEDDQGPEGICRDICIVNIKDGSKVNLTDSPKFDDRDIAWSPDGKRIAFSSRRQVIDMQIYVMNTDGSQVSKLTTGDSSNYFPSWSPDGKKIVFTSGEDICIMDDNGSHVINLTNTPDIDDYLAIWSTQ
jgi:Tol biopolymer transport system component